MPDNFEAATRIDALVMSPVRAADRRRAARAVCALMGQAGDARDDIRDVLDALGLLDDDALSVRS